MEKLEQCLTFLANSVLKPTPESLDSARDVASTVFEALKASRFKISRQVVAGSVGKNTCLAQNFDLDLVAFVSDETPPFKQVLQNFVLCMDGLGITEIKVTQHSLQFQYRGFAVDLLPAADLVNKKIEEDNSNSNAEEQKQATMVVMKGIYDRCKIIDLSYSSSLAESQVHFMSTKSEYIQSLTRLTKMWVKSTQLPYLSGKSLIVELISVYVGEIQETESTPLLYNGLLSFLDAIIGFNALQINNFPDTRTPREFLRPPILMDPANSYNNLAQSIHPSVVNSLISYANASRVKLMNCLNRNHQLQYLFTPQPASIKLHFRFKAVLLEVQRATDITHPLILNRSKGSFDEIELLDLKHVVVQRLLIGIQVLMGDRIQNFSIYDVMESAMSTLDPFLNEKMWKYSAERHSDYNLTVTIPFELHAEKYHLLVSFQKSEGDPLQGSVSILRTSIPTDTFPVKWELPNYSDLPRNVIKSSLFKGGPRTNHVWQLELKLENGAVGSHCVGLYLHFVQFGRGLKNKNPKACNTCFTVKFADDERQDIAHMSHRSAIEKGKKVSFDKIQIGDVAGTLYITGTLSIEIESDSEDEDDIVGNSESGGEQNKRRRLYKFKPRNSTLKAVDDVVVSTKTENFLASREILSSQSTVLDDELGLTDTLTIENVSSSSVKIFLNLLHNIHVDEHDLEFYAVDLLALAHRFDVASIKQKLEETLAQLITPHTVFKYLETSVQSESKILQGKILDFLRENLQWKEDPDYQRALQAHRSLFEEANLEPPVPNTTATVEGED